MFAEGVRTRPLRSSVPQLGLSTDRIWLLAALAIGLALVPVLVTPVPPLLDYPWHLARMQILAHPDAPFIREWFAVDWSPIPNLAMDVVVACLGQLMPVAIAARILLAAILALLATGTVALHRAWHGRASAWPLLAVLLLYNWILTLGFINYLLGLALVLWCVAGTLKLQDRPLWVRAGTMTVFSLALYFAHLMALGLFGAVVVALELARAVRQGRPPLRTLAELAVLGVAFLPAALLLLFGSPTGERAGEILHWWSKKLLMAATPFTGSIATDVLVTLALATLFAVALWRRWLSMASGAAAVLVLLLVLLAVLPYRVFGSEYADLRLPIAAAFLAIAAVDLRPIDARWQRWAAVLLALVFVVRIVGITVEWQRSQPVIADRQAGFARLEPGSIMFTAAVDQPIRMPFEQPDWWRPPREHLPALALLARPVLVPQTYMLAGHQPTRLADDYAVYRRVQRFGTNRASTPDQPTFEAWLRDIDAVIAEGGKSFSAVYAMIDDPEQALRPPAGWVSMHRGADYALLRRAP